MAKETKIGIRPLGDRVVVRPEEKGEELGTLAIEAEAFSENIGWLFERLEFKATDFLKSLRETGGAS